MFVQHLLVPSEMPVLRHHSVQDTSLTSPLKAAEQKRLKVNLEKHLENGSDSASPNSTPRSGLETSPKEGASRPPPRSRQP